ncbi:MAG: pyridoxamine 5'-phosphate oxidase family protein [Candidatus Promineifilaceae bacterium]
MTHSDRPRIQDRVRRVPERGIYDRAEIYKIIDEALICHIGFEQYGQPYVIPTIHARDGDDLLLHGATSSRLLRHIQKGHPICVAVTILDGLVLARSIFHHSMNYRSAVLFGTGRVLDKPAETLRALEILSDHVMPGRWHDCRQPNDKELKATSVAAISIASASAKVRYGPPGDEEVDYQLPYWAGVLPVQLQFSAPEVDPRLDFSIDLPEYVKSYKRIAKPDG